MSLRRSASTRSVRLSRARPSSWCTYSLRVACGPDASSIYSWQSKAGENHNTPTAIPAGFAQGFSSEKSRSETLRSWSRACLPRYRARGYRSSALRWHDGVEVATSLGLELLTFAPPYIFRTAAQKGTSVPSSNLVRRDMNQKKAARKTPGRNSCGAASFHPYRGGGEDLNERKSENETRPSQPSPADPAATSSLPGSWLNWVRLSWSAQASRDAFRACANTRAWLCLIRVNCLSR